VNQKRAERMHISANAAYPTSRPSRRSANRLCAWRHNMPPPRLKARCGPPPVHSLQALRLRRPARLAPWIFMIDRQRLALGGGVETGLVDIHYAVTWIANQSGLVTLNFDLESGDRVTRDVGYLCANFGLPRPLSSRLRPDVRVKQTDRRQTKASLNAPAY